MMTIALEGADELQARLSGLPPEMLDNLSAKAALLAQALADKVRDDKLSGGVLNAASGALRASIVAEVGADCLVNGREDLQQDKDNSNESQPVVKATAALHFADEQAHGHSKNRGQNAPQH